jgi:TetR/AcrR family transcriptional regulator, cholesterol catabolism regulator
MEKDVTSRAAVKEPAVRTIAELQAELAQRIVELTPAIGRSDTRERILETAIDRFARHGFEACSVRDLATAVGIKAPGIYSHFRSKEAILSEAMMRALHGFLTTMSAPIDARNPEDELREIVQRHVLYQLEHLQLARANDLLLNSDSVGRYLPTEDHQLLLDAQRAYYHMVRARVAAVLGKRRSPDPAVTTLAITTMCDHVTSWFQPGGRLDARQVAEQYWLLVRGMIGA